MTAHRFIALAAAARGTSVTRQLNIGDKLCGYMNSWSSISAGGHALPRHCETTVEFNDEMGTTSPGWRRLRLGSNNNTILDSLQNPVTASNFSGFF